MLMKLSNDSIEKLLKVMPKYWNKEYLNLNMKKLCQIFNKVGFENICTSRYTVFIGDKECYRPEYFKLRLNNLNGRHNSKKVFELLGDSRTYDSNKINDNDIDTFLKEINDIIKYDNYKLNKNSNSIYNVEYIKIDYKDCVIQAYFEDIQKNIIDEIQNTKYSIRICVAWFTNNIIYEELKKTTKR